MEQLMGKDILLFVFSGYRPHGEFGLKHIIDLWGLMMAGIVIVDSSLF